MLGLGLHGARGAGVCGGRGIDTGCREGDVGYVEAGKGEKRI